MKTAVATVPSRVTAHLDHVTALAPGPGLLFGLMLVAAILGGYLAHALHVPRVIGYLLAGCALNLLLSELLKTDPSTQGPGSLDLTLLPLNAISDLGLGIILFSIGGVFEARHIRSIRTLLSKVSFCENATTFLLVFVATAAAAAFTNTAVPALTVLSFALFLGFASLATAPAATLMVLREYDAKGPVTDTLLSLTAVNNILCIILFHLAFMLLATFGVLGPVQLSSGAIWVNLLTTIPGSILLGTVLGFALSLIHAKLPPQETLLILVALLIVTGASEQWLLEHHAVTVNFLLTAIFMGATFANLAIDPSRLDEPLQIMSRPILVGFFVIAGYKLHLAELAQLQFIGAAYIIARLIGKATGVYFGLKWAKAGSELRPYMGAALFCQAAVVIGLADFADANWPSEWSRQFVTVALGSVLIFEIGGPLMVKSVVKKAGEVRAVTLLRRTSGPSTGSASIWSLTWQALWRTLGLSHPNPGKAESTLQVRHVMRTNIKCIPAEVNFDEVLRFVEHSKFSDFPVIDENQEVLGVIHFSDIREILYDPGLAHLLLAVDLANLVYESAPADMPLEDVLALFHEGDVGSLPVVEAEGSRKIVGIIEQRDVLRTLHLHRPDPK